LQLDKTVISGILANIWLIIAGPVTMLMIVLHFSSEMQGYYYTFNSLIALRVFVELGLSAVIISFASHEWSKLSINRTGFIVGDTNALSRLISLIRIVFVWYFIGGIIVLFVLGFGGYHFFLHEKTSSYINWALPWLFLCLSTAINIWLAPALFLLEGCNQIKRIYNFKMVRGIIVSLCSWYAIALGVGLWALVINATVNILCLLAFILSKYKNFFKPILSYTTSSVINWRTDLWPMQWRISLSWISGYFMASFFTPLIFHFRGSVLSGQFGMTWAMFTALGSVSNIWLAVKRPQFGILIAKQEYKLLDKLFFRTAILSIAVFAIGVAVVWSIIYVLNVIEHPWASRLLSPITAGVFCVGLTFVYITAPFSYYLRAHKKDPLFWVDIFAATLIAVFALIVINNHGALGTAIVYTTIQSSVVFPLVIWGWYRLRIKWHKNVVHV